MAGPLSTPGARDMPGPRDTLVRGGLVVYPEGRRSGDVVLSGGRVEAIEPPGSVDTTGVEVFDAGGLWVLPGLLDAHVHLQEPGRESWEGFDTGSAAAAAGGVTTVVDMPIDSDPPTTTAALVHAKVEAARRTSRVDVAIWGGLTAGSVGAMGEMADAGVAGFKAFACPSGWADFPPADTDTLHAGMVEAARAGLPVAVHCELAHLGHSPESEVAAIRWAAGLAARAGARLHVVHVSAAEAVDEAVSWPGVTVETCPHYLLLDDHEADSIGPTARCAPPIRGPANRVALWERVCQGAVDTIASDHSPCPPEARHGPSPWSGIDGLGLALPLLVSGGLPLERLVNLTTAAAHLLRLPGKGRLAVGADADLALVDPSETWTVGPTTTWSRHRSSPFAGRRVQGRVVLTVRRGQVIFSAANGPSEAGGGRFLRPSPAPGGAG